MQVLRFNRPNRENRYTDPKFIYTFDNLVGKSILLIIEWSKFDYSKSLITTQVICFKKKLYIYRNSNGDWRMNQQI